MKKHIFIDHKALEDIAGNKTATIKLALKSMKL